MNLLLSYPRSGSTWLRYMIANTSNIMCLGQDLKENILDSQEKIGINRRHRKNYNISKEFSEDFLERVLIKCHDLEEIPSFWSPEKCGIDWIYPFFFNDEESRSPKNILDTLDDNYFRLIFLYRDPLEVCSRERNCFSDIGGYAKLFKQYLDYKGEKMIISYNDLMKDPRGVLDSVLLFLDYDYTFSSIKFDKFFKYIHLHKKGAIKLYEQGYGYRSHTKGEPGKEDFHQSMVKGKTQAYRQLKQELGSSVFDSYFFQEDVEKEIYDGSDWSSDKDAEKMKIANKESRLRGAAHSLGIPANLIYNPPKLEELGPISAAKEEKIEEKSDKVGFFKKCFGVLFGRRGSNKS
jgi:hypothetical protein